MAPRDPQQNNSLSYVGAKEVAIIILAVIVLAGTAASLALFVVGARAGRERMRTRCKRSAAPGGVTMQV
jgi:hypothetical protein